jgi:heat shock protein HtpX
VNTAKTAFLMILLMALFVLIGKLVGGTQGMVIAFALAVLMNIFSYWFSDKIVLKLYRARAVEEAEAPKLYAMIRRLTQRAGMPMPKVCIIPQAAPNAFATGRNPSHAAVAVTQGLLDMLDDDAVEGVIAHELSHVGNHDILIGTIAATIAGAIMVLAYMARFAAIFGGGRDRRGSPFALIFVAIFGAIAAMMIQMAISRSREYQADASAAKLTGNPRGLMRALDALQRGAERVPMQAGQATAHMFIVNPFSRRGVRTLLSTHPPIEERIERLANMQSR